MSTANSFKLKIENLGCANCAVKMEEVIREIEGVEEANLNFATKTLFLKMDELGYKKSLDLINKKISEIEPGAFIKTKDETVEYKLKIENLGCATCAAKIEDAIRELESVSEAHINFATKTLFLKMSESDFIREIDYINNKVSEIEPGAYIDLNEPQKSNREKYESKDKVELAKLLIPMALFFISFIVKNEPIKQGLLLIAYIGSGYKVIGAAVRNIFRGELFDENFLMTVASLGAILIGEFSEGVAVMIFYSVGEFMQDLAVDKSRKSISELMDLRPNFANVLVNGQMLTMDPLEIKIGDHIIVKPGEKVPIDTEVIEGHSMIDTSALTGESLPREVGPGDEILSGSVNLSSTMELKVTQRYEDSAVSKILDLVENSGSKKAVTEKLITRFAKYYTPVVVLTALALALVPPLITGDDFSKWIYRSLVFLVASCPCALVVSIPLGFFAGIGRAGKEGILIKGGNFLESISKANRFVFDKTGTLTHGKFTVSSVNPAEGIDRNELLRMAYIAESMSDHPIAESIKNEYGSKEVILSKITDIPGRGVVSYYEEMEILAGNAKLMNMYNIDYIDANGGGTTVYVAVNSLFYGSILIADEVKSEAKDAITKLKELGVGTITMLTGDNEATAKKVAENLGIDDVNSEMLPQDKVGELERIIEERHTGTVAFVGDGINDAPALMLSDVGISMGQVGTDAAIEAADIVIMKDNLLSLTTLLKISKNTMHIIYQNIVFALGFKFIVLILGATGRASMWFAVFADTGVAIIAILNSIRILRKRI